MAVVPNEAQNAQKKLKQSDETIRIMERMRASQRVTLRGSDAAAVAEEWRDIARQYQLAIRPIVRLLLYKITPRFLLTIPTSVQSNSGVSVTGAADIAVPVDDVR